MRMRQPNFLPLLFLLALLASNLNAASSAHHTSNRIPRSLPSLPREALLRAVTVVSSAVLVGSTASSGASPPSRCMCTDRSLVCDCAAGQVAVAEQMSQIGSGIGNGPVLWNERIYDTRKRSFLPAHPEIYLSKETVGKKVIVVGEIHSNRFHHHCEFEIARAISQNPTTAGKFSIGLECFYRQHQNALDDFIFSHQNFGKLKQDVDWDDAWGYDLNYYAKIFNYAAQNKIRLVGLNVPYAVAKFVGAKGFDALPSSVRQYLPNLDLSNKKHRDQFLEAVGAGHSSSSSSMSSEDQDKDVSTSTSTSIQLQHMYEAQTLWDEYMAESASNYVNANPDQTLMVIAGAGHVLGRTGIPDRIKRRIGGQAPFVILPQQVQWSSATGLPEISLPLDTSDADWCWYTE